MSAYLKPSNYNIFCSSSIGKAHLAYNTLTNAFLVLSENDFHLASELLVGKVDTDSQSEIQALLEQNGFLIPDDVSEKNRILNHFKRSQRSKRSFALTIAPTLDCNLRCRYCFIEHTTKRMSSKVQAGLVEYVKRRLPKNGNFFVTWYGGEPLLEKKILFSLSAIFKEICKQKKTRYEARIITNGTLLTEETVKLLKEENVVNAQITLDGIPDKHNKRRPFKSHEGSFDIILRHMKTASLHLHVIVRINMDKSNLETAKELLHLLDQEGVLPRIFPYLGRVQPYSDVCRHVMPDCLDITDFSKIELEFDLEKCFLTRDLRHAIIIERKSNYCMADGNQGYVVSPEGYLFKCYNEVGSGSENAVGSVLHKQTKEMKRNLRQWRTWSPFSSPECISCRFLPVCFGGCPWQNRQMKEKPNRACISWRYTVEERMRLHHALSTIASLEKND